MQNKDLWDEAKADTIYKPPDTTADQHLIDRSDMRAGCVCGSCLPAFKCVQQFGIPLLPANLALNNQLVLLLVNPRSCYCLL